MSDQPAKKQTFSFRFRTLSDETRFLAKVKELGTTPSDLARDFIAVGLDRELAGDEPPGPADRATHSPSVRPSDELKRLVVKAAWATIVALSPDLNEETAAQFLREVFGSFE